MKRIERSVLTVLLAVLILAQAVPLGMADTYVPILSNEVAGPSVFVWPTDEMDGAPNIGIAGI